MDGRFWQVKHHWSTWLRFIASDDVASSKQCHLWAASAFLAWIHQFLPIDSGTFFGRVRWRHLAGVIQSNDAHDGAGEPATLWRSAHVTRAVQLVDTAWNSLTEINNHPWNRWTPEGTRGNQRAPEGTRGHQRASEGNQRCLIAILISSDGHRINPILLDPFFDDFISIFWISIRKKKILSMTLTRWHGERRGNNGVNYRPPIRNIPVHFQHIPAEQFPVAFIIRLIMGFGFELILFSLIGWEISGHLHQLENPPFSSFYLKSTV